MYQGLQFFLQLAGNEPMTGTFTSKEWIIMLAIFLTSGGYWLLLDWWYGHDADSYDANTWFLVVVGVGYVLLWLLAIITLEIWFRVFMAFVSAAVLIIARSLVINAQRNRRTKEGLNRQDEKK
jgi:hypothetical protein